jgi:hypothetical protein
MFHRGFGNALTIGLTLLAAPALAQDRALEIARQNFDEAQNLYLEGKYSAAVDKFQKAYEAKSFAAFLYNVAVCYEKNNDLEKALHFYEQYLKEESKPLDRPAVVKRIASLREGLRLRAAASRPSSQPSSSPTSQPVGPPPPKLPPVNTKGLVIIESKPPGAAIYLEDKKRGVFRRTPYTGSITEGQHTAIIELRKFKPERKTFYARADRMVYLYFALSKEEYLGWIEIKANVPGADVYFDKKEEGAVGRTPYTGFLRPGKRALIIERDGYEPYVRTIDITPGQDHVVDVNMQMVSYGWLKVTGRTTKGATVKVNGLALDCKEYPCRAKIAPGSYKVELIRKGFKKYTQRVSISRATETQLAVRLHPAPSRLKAYFSFGAHAALLTGAIVTAVMSKNRRDSLQQDYANGQANGGYLYTSGDPRLSSGRLNAIVADSLFALAGVTGALGFYYLFRNVGPDSYGEARVNKVVWTPLVSPQVAGVAGQVRF